MLETVEVYKESRENYEPAWRKGTTTKPTKCTGLYFLGETSFNVNVFVVAVVIRLSRPPYFQMIRLTTLLLPRPFLIGYILLWTCPLTSGRRFVWTDVVSIFDSLVTILLTLAVKLV